MDIPSIRTESDYLTALKTIECHFETEPDPDSQAGGLEIILSLAKALIPYLGGKVFYFRLETIRHFSPPNQTLTTVV